MTIHLPENLERSILEVVQCGQFGSIDDAMAEAARLLLRQLEQRHPKPEQHAVGQESPAVACKPVWERIMERAATVPDEEWDKVPADLAEQHDHYIYGTPKRPTV